MDAVDLFAEGERCRLAGDYRGSVASLTRALAVGADPVSTYLALVVARLRLEEFTAALADCDAALAYGATHARAYYYRGIILRRMERYAEAVVDLNRAIRLQPGFGVAYLERGLCHLKLGAKELAERDLKTALAFVEEEGMGREESDGVASFAQIPADFLGAEEGWDDPTLRVSGEAIHRLRSLLH